MKWFVVFTAVTLLWGNGAWEEARTSPAEVFKGTSEQCAAYADDVEKGATAFWKKDSARLARDYPHAEKPRLYFGGIKAVAGVRAFCIDFQSTAAIKSFFPNGWHVIGGVRAKPEGGTEPFHWWEEP